MSIRDYLPSRSKNNQLIQGAVPTELVLATKAIMRREKLKWSEVLTACLKQFNEEKALKKK